MGSFNAVLLILFAALVGGCGGGGGGKAVEKGTLKLALTDAPACGFQSINITVRKIRVHQSSTASESDSGWSEVVLSPETKVDLLSLQNGVLLELGQTSLPVGRYTQLRLVLGENSNTTPLANSVTPTGGTEAPLDSPSAFESGLKLNVDINVDKGTVADFVLDFKACQSVVPSGNSGRYNLKPVLSVVPRVSDVAITGYLNTNMAPATTTISAQINGQPLKSTTPDSAGKFVLAPIPSGTYDVVITSAGHATATITGVPVTSTTGASLNDGGDPSNVISPPTSTDRTLSGHVVITPTPSIVDAVLVVKQTYSGGPTIEVANRPADAQTGAFSFSLRAAAPVKTTYSASSSNNNFIADPTATGGVYSLVATSGGTTKTIPVNVSMGNMTGQFIGFP